MYLCVLSLAHGAQAALPQGLCRCPGWKLHLSTATLVASFVAFFFVPWQSLTLLPSLASFASPAHRYPFIRCDIAPPMQGLADEPSTPVIAAVAFSLVLALISFVGFSFQRYRCDCSGGFLAVVGRFRSTDGSEAAHITGLTREDRETTYLLHASCLVRLSLDPPNLCSYCQHHPDWG